MSSLGENIRNARIRKGISQEELATALNTTKSAISRYELGKRQPKHELVEQMAVVLQIDPFEIYFGTTQEALSQKIDRQMNEYWTEMRSSDLPDNARHLVNVFLRLNDLGQEKAIERVEELAEIPKYKNSEL